ncbi:hypothetical protein HY643_01235 [Candidatus Woesearchaeota archaeon]|nr:hypothetical protein [Candidatus Woesearchaeota archaeon]
MGLLEKIFDDLRLKEQIETITYNGKVYDSDFKLNRDVVNNFAVHINELNSDIIINYFAFPYGGLSGQPSKAWVKNAFRLKGKLTNKNIDLEIEVSQPNDPFPEYKPFEGDEEKIKQLVTHYRKELSSFVAEKVKEKTVDKALKSWQKTLGLKPEAAEVLKSYVKDNLKQYYTREITVLYIPLLGMLFAKGGQAVFVGSNSTHSYTRRLSPIVGLPPFNIINNVAKRLINKVSHAPTPTTFENPEEVAIFLPPVFGFFAKKHEVRHGLQYAAFHELINPNSMLYNGLSAADAKDKAYSNLEELVAVHKENLGEFPVRQKDDGRIVDAFLKDKLLPGLLNDIKKNDYLSRSYERGIIAGILFSTAYKKHQRNYEATASSLTGNLMLIALPWALLGLANPSEVASNAPFIAMLNGFMAMFGYGNVFSYAKSRKKIISGETAEEQLKAITTLGSR